MRSLVTRALVLTLVTLAPGAAVASPWGWLDKLSGPGPFDANGRLFFPVPITRTNETSREPNKIFKIGDNLDERKLYVVFETTRWTGKTNDNFVGAVNMTTAEGVLFVHPAGWRDPKSPLSSLDVGIGLGAYRFSGEGVTSDGQPDGAFWRVAIPLRIRFTPSELAAGRLSTKWRNGLAVFSYMIGWDILPGTFDGTDFVVAPKDAGYRSSGNAPFTFGVIVDITPVLFNR